jgi:hypothetical protein
MSFFWIFLLSIECIYNYTIKPEGKIVKKHRAGNFEDPKKQNDEEESNVNVVIKGAHA